MPGISPFFGSSHTELLSPFASEIWLDEIISMGQALTTFKSQGASGEPENPSSETTQLQRADLVSKDIIVGCDVPLDKTFSCGSGLSDRKGLKTHRRICHSTVASAKRKAERKQRRHEIQADVKSVLHQVQNEIRILRKQAYLSQISTIKLT